MAERSDYQGNSLDIALHVKLHTEYHTRIARMSLRFGIRNTLFDDDLFFREHTTYCGSLKKLVG
jgi:hypothetical protein